MEALTYEGLKIYHENNKKMLEQAISDIDSTNVEKSEINGNIKINGTEIEVYTPQEYYTEY